MLDELEHIERTGSPRRPETAESEASFSTEGADEHTSIWLSWHETRAPELRQQLISAYLPHARMLAAKTFSTRTHDEVAFADYYQLASVGLIEAVDRYDLHRNVKFRAYAAKRIVGSILNGLECQTEKTRQISVQRHLRHERLAHVKAMAQRKTIDHETVGDSPQQAGSAGRNPEELFRYLSEVGIGVALGILLEGTGMIDHEAFESPNRAASPEVSYFRHEALRTLQAQINDALPRLSPAQQLVIQLHYLQSMSFADIAGRLALSRGRISQLHRQSLEHLRNLMRPPPAFDVLA